MVTFMPRACRSLANDALMMPFPRLEETPPVTKMYLVAFACPVVPCIRDSKVRPFLGLEGRKFPCAVHRS